MTNTFGRNKSRDRNALFAAAADIAGARRAIGQPHHRVTLTLCSGVIQGAPIVITFQQLPTPLPWRFERRDKLSKPSNTRGTPTLLILDWIYFLNLNRAENVLVLLWCMVCVFFRREQLFYQTSWPDFQACHLFWRYFGSSRCIGQVIILIFVVVYLIIAGGEKRFLVFYLTTPLTQHPLILN